jgi:hypothetical protein
MDTFNLSLAFAAGAAAGGVNAIAGGGALIAFPALLMTGLSPISANATTNAAVFFGTLASAGGYVEQVRPYRTISMKLACMSLAGGLIGAVLMLTTAERVFIQLVPLLILVAALLFTFGPRVARLIPSASGTIALSPWTLAGHFAISVYGGYFGAGQGFAILALLTLIGFRKMHEMNGIKSFLATCTNGMALIPFMVAGSIAWREALVMSIGTMAGGYAGAALAQRVPPERVRHAVVTLAYMLVAYFFFKVYG